jgi:hypothetical protein
MPLDDKHTNIKWETTLSNSEAGMISLQTLNSTVQVNWIGNAVVEKGLSNQKAAPVKRKSNRLVKQEFPHIVILYVPIPRNGVTQKKV